MDFPFHRYGLLRAAESSTSSRGFFLLLYDLGLYSSRQGCSAYAKRPPARPLLARPLPCPTLRRRRRPLPGV